MIFTWENGIIYATSKDLLTKYGDQTIIYDAQDNPTSYLGHTLTWEKGRQLKRIDISDAIVDIGVDVGIIAASTSIGAAVGSVVPGLGNIVGAGVGMAAGWLIDGAVNAKVFGGESAVYWAKEGAGWIADRVVDAGEWIADTAVEAWDATTDFVEDAGEAVGGFFEDAGNAIGGFFSGLFA